MEGDEPAGGRWNFDSENRKACQPACGHPPDRALRPIRSRPTCWTWSLRALRRISAISTTSTGGEAPGALAALDMFVTEALPQFGDFQDAMAQQEPFLFHALISPYLNVGLLTARRGLRRGGNGLPRRTRPLNAVELHPPDPRLARIRAWRLLAGNAQLCADNPPGRGAAAAMVLLVRRDADELPRLHDRRHQAHAYAHHIQRLMVTGNFACSPASARQRSRPGISLSMRTLSNGSNCPMSTAW